MKRYLICAAIAIVMFGCNSNKGEYASSESLNKVEAMDSASTADTIATPKIIKTADMRFRVKDVQQTKEQLTSTIKAQGGTVAEFSINSYIQESNKVRYSVDSLKEITSYRKEGMLVAKIPSEKLDDFINTIARRSFSIVLN